MVPSNGWAVRGCGPSRLDGHWQERRILALERLGHTAAPAVRHGLRHGIGEDVLLLVLHSVEDASRDGLRRGLRYVEASGHVRVHGAEHDRMYAHAPSCQMGTQRL